MYCVYIIIICTFRNKSHECVKIIPTTMKYCIQCVQTILTITSLLTLSPDYIHTTEMHIRNTLFGNTTG